MSILRQMLEIPEDKTGAMDLTIRVAQRAPPSCAGQRAARQSGPGNRNHRGP